MKKVFILVLILSSMLMPSFFTSPLQKAYARGISDNSVIVLSGKTNKDGTLEIKANLVENPGIGGMTLELDYDSTAMVLKNVEFGDALNSLSPVHTIARTEQEFAFRPFKFNYFGMKVSNDYSTGLLFTLYFKINDNVQDGDYRISLKFVKNQDIIYYDSENELQTKNLYIDNTEIAIKNNSVVKVTTIEDSEKPNNIWLVVVIVSVIVVGITGAIIYIIFLTKKRRNWKRL